MDSDPDREDYNTPLVADLEIAFRRLVRFQIKLLAGFVVALVIVGLMTGAVIYWASSRPTTVPDIRGLDNVSAALALDRAGLSSGYIRIEEASTTVPYNHVISTDPVAGTDLRRGGVIRVTFSCGPPRGESCGSPAPT